MDPIDAAAYISSMAATAIARINLRLMCWQGLNGQSACRRIQAPLVIVGRIIGKPERTKALKA
jgi:hypothetical protein